MCRWSSLSGLRKGREEKVDYEGKIEGRGTRPGLRPGLHVGLRGTRAVTRGAWVEAKCLARRTFGRASPDRLRWGWHRGAV